MKRFDAADNVIGRENTDHRLRMSGRNVKHGQQNGRCGIAPARFGDHLVFGVDPDPVQVAFELVPVFAPAYDPDIVVFEHRQQPFDRRLHQRIVADKPNELFGIQLS